MYEYRFETVDLRGRPTGYQGVVAQRALEGWRLVQILVEIPAAVPSSYVLVLERPAPAAADAVAGAV